MPTTKQRVEALESAMRTRPGCEDDLRAQEVAGTALLEAVRGSDAHEKLYALLDRLELNVATFDDRKLLDSLPRCAMTPHALVRLYARVTEMF